MRIDKLTLHQFKNLRDFAISFDEKSPTTVLIGRNGTGKSNLLEALTIIFRDLDLGKAPSLKYEISYYIYRNKVKHKVEIDADPDRVKDSVSIKVDGEAMSYNKFIENSKTLSTRYLPNMVFGYYSGFNERMKEHFYKHQDIYYQALIHNIERPLRTLFYSEPIHSNFVLLSFFTKDTGVELNFLKKNLGIEALESVLFIMTEPPWESKKGDPRFWNAGGTVQDFLAKLYKLALAPLRRTQTVKLDFRRTKKLEHLYLYLKDAEALQQLASVYRNNQSEFFKALESTYISDLIKEVRPRFRARNVDGSLTFREMSEGEQQLLMVLGLMRFTNEKESLYLLDEPDTHLNPEWSLQYLKFVRQLVGDQKTSHLILCTHDPLLLAGLEQSQVQIMRRDEETEQIRSDVPTEDPRGMGIAAILTSNMFGLKAALDEETQKLLEKRRELADRPNLTKKEQKQLERLNQELAGLDFSITMRDPLYTEFVLAMNKLQGNKIKENVVLTPQQQKSQQKLALKILRELKSKSR